MMMMSRFSSHEPVLERFGSLPVAPSGEVVVVEVVVVPDPSLLALVVEAESHPAVLVLLIVRGRVRVLEQQRLHLLGPPHAPSVSPLDLGGSARARAREGGVHVLLSVELAVLQRGPELAEVGVGKGLRLRGGQRGLLAAARLQNRLRVELRLPRPHQALPLVLPLTAACYPSQLLPHHSHLRLRASPLLPPHACRHRTSPLLPPHACRQRPSPVRLFRDRNFSLVLPQSRPGRFRSGSVGNPGFRDASCIRNGPVWGKAGGLGLLGYGREISSAAGAMLLPPHARLRPLSPLLLVCTPPAEGRGVVTARAPRPRNVFLNRNVFLLASRRFGSAVTPSLL
ncbi:hypothetical protein T492DRAFT_1092955, partial [Pavlovales sp. CCMP2436]